MIDHLNPVEDRTLSHAIVHDFLSPAEFRTIAVAIYLGGGDLLAELSQYSDQRTYTPYWRVYAREVLTRLANNNLPHLRRMRWRVLDALEKAVTEVGNDHLHAAAIATKIHGADPAMLPGIFAGIMVHLQLVAHVLIHHAETGADQRPVRVSAVTGLTPLDHWLAAASTILVGLPSFPTDPLAMMKDIEPWDEEGAIPIMFEVVQAIEVLSADWEEHGVSTAETLLRIKTAKREKLPFMLDEIATAMKDAGSLLLLSGGAMSSKAQPVPAEPAQDIDWLERPSDPPDVCDGSDVLEAANPSGKANSATPDANPADGSHSLPF